MKATQHWHAMGTQSTLLSCPGDEILFAGQARSGRTSGVLGHWLLHADTYGKDANGVIFRRQYRSAVNWFTETEPLFKMIGGQFSAATMTWLMPNRAKLKIRHVEDTDEVDTYAANAFSWIGFEHAEDWETPDVIDRTKMFLRSMTGAKCQMLLTADTTKAAGTWIEERFVVPTPERWNKMSCVLGGSTSRIFIPARLTDEPAAPAKREIDYSAITRSLVG